MNDEQGRLMGRIEALTTALNRAIKEASTKGIRVELETFDGTVIGSERHDVLISSCFVSVGRGTAKGER